MLVSGLQFAAYLDPAHPEHRFTTIGRRPQLLRRVHARQTKLHVHANPAAWSVARSLSRTAESTSCTRTAGNATSTRRARRASNRNHSSICSSGGVWGLIVISDWPDALVARSIAARSASIVRVLARDPAAMLRVAMRVAQAFATAWRS